MTNSKPRQVRPAVESGPRPVLTFTAQRRGKPPRHFADLSVEERKEVAEKLEVPGFRMDQIARQYYVHRNADTSTMTDLPAADRERLGEVLFPPLLEKVRDLEADGGSTVIDADRRAHPGAD